VVGINVKRGLRGVSASCLSARCAFSSTSGAGGRSGVGHGVGRGDAVDIRGGGGAVVEERSLESKSLLGGHPGLEVVPVCGSRIFGRFYACVFWGEKGAMRAVSLALGKGRTMQWPGAVEKQRACECVRQVSGRGGEGRWPRRCGRVHGGAQKWSRWWWCRSSLCGGAVRVHALPTIVHINVHFARLHRG
jgi:hypothetical protein